MLEHKKEFLTFNELKERWNIDEADIRRLIITKKIIPSFFVSRPSHKIRFELTEELHWKPILIEYSGDEEKRGLAKDLFLTRKFYYLVHPLIESAFDCSFIFFSENKYHEKGLEEINHCFHVSTYLSNPYREGIPLKQVISHGVVMIDEVERYEMENLISSEKNSEDHVNNSNHWPWGSHHTKLLGALEAAAKRYWVNFDPSDFSTAPTNETVSDWLVKNYKISEEKNISKHLASTIATLLRADSLPPGPRS